MVFNVIRTILQSINIYVLNYLALDLHKNMKIKLIYSSFQNYSLLQYKKL